MVNLNIAFWNVNMGEGSPRDKLNTFADWYTLLIQKQNIILDLLVLEEATEGFLLRGIVPQGMTLINYVPILDVNLRDCGKNIAVYERNGLGFVARSLGMREIDQRRNLAKITNQQRIGGRSVWGIHANASVRGGRAAFDGAREYLESDRGSVVGGDFNHDISRLNPLPAGVVRPLSHQNTLLNFTQWKSLPQHATHAPNAHLHLPSRGVYYKGFETHGVIDYIMIDSPNVAAVALPNCADEAIWLAILRNFDHCPVVYRLTFP